MVPTRTASLLAFVVLSTAAQAQDVPAISPDDEGIWAWVERLDGELLPAQAEVELEERADERMAELAVLDDLIRVDVPNDFYDDPLAALTGDPLALDLLDPDEFDIPIVVNASVEKSMRYFLGNGRRWFAKWLARGPRYHALMQRELEAAGLPLDLVYLAMIESGYSNYAYSHADAAGLWQFIPSTGRSFGLRIEWWVDDHRDPHRFTRAAVEYLSQLYRMFDDWHLAMAAYNGGPGRVGRALERSGATDFWALQEGSWLHSETDAYVPRIIAAAIIAKHPERYGFEVDPQSELVVETASVEGSVALSILAECAGIGVEAFQTLNPALRRGATPDGTTEIRLPVGTRSRFLAQLADVPEADRSSWAHHTVRPGETLSSIAGKYGVGVEEVLEVNQLRDADHIGVGQALLIPGAGAPPASATASKSTAAPTFHVVVTGDTLSGIASRYDVGISQLRKWNGLRGSTIHPGQRLQLRAPAESEPVDYAVQAGDSVSQIAARYAVSIDDVIRWNRLSDPGAIRVGQVLTLHLDDSGWRVYTVRSGDSLGRIAQKNGVTVSELQGWNGLGSSTIYPGQRLRIRSAGP